MCRRSGTTRAALSVKVRRQLSRNCRERLSGKPRRGVARFCTIDDSFPPIAETLSPAGESSFLFDFAAHARASPTKPDAYFRLPRQINAKMKSKLFHGTTSPNGERNSTVERVFCLDVVHASGTSRRVTAGSWAGKKRRRKEEKGKRSCLSLRRQADYREHDHATVTLYRLLLHPFLPPPFSPLLLAPFDTHVHRNKKPRRSSFATPLTLSVRRYAQRPTLRPCVGPQ